MRVLHIQKVSGIGGSERHLAMLLPALADRGIDVRMCVLAADQADRFVALLEAADVDTVSLPAGADVNPWLLTRLAAEVRRFRPDIVHTHLIHGDAYGQVAARLTRTPSVASVHAAHDSYRRQPYRSIGTLVGRSAAVTIAISRSVASAVLSQGFAPAEKIRVIHYGMDAAGWELTPPERAAARQELGLSPSDVAVGIASRLTQHKGHDTVLAAIGPVVAENPRVRLLVAGDGPRRADLQRQSSTAPPGAVTFTGFVPDIRRFMNACDVMVFPTDAEFGEGFGLAALEAMAAARPLVASDVGPIPEIVVPEVTGLLVPASTPAAFGTALLRLAADEDLRRRMGRAAADRVRDTFGLDRMVDATIEVYADVSQGSIADT